MSHCTQCVSCDLLVVVYFDTHLKEIISCSSDDNATQQFVYRFYLLYEHNFVKYYIIVQCFALSTSTGQKAAVNAPIGERNASSTPRRSVWRRHGAARGVPAPPGGTPTGTLHTPTPTDTRTDTHTGRTHIRIICIRK